MKKRQILIQLIVTKVKFIQFRLATFFRLERLRKKYQAEFFACIRGVLADLSDENFADECISKSVTKLRQTLEEKHGRQTAVEAFLYKCKKHLTKTLK